MSLKLPHSRVFLWIVVLFFSANTEPEFAILTLPVRLDDDVNCPFFDIAAAGVDLIPTACGEQLQLRSVVIVVYGGFPGFQFSRIFDVAFAGTLQPKHHPAFKRKEIHEG